MKTKEYIPYLFLLIFLICNIGFWTQSKQVRTEWANVPFVPSKSAALMNFLGDQEVAYRVYAIMLQNIGSMDGQIMSLKDYNYERLKEWFFLEDSLNIHSDIVPMLAAYYFGAVEDKEKLKYILDYLSVVGQRSEGEKWRWLGHAVFLARHKMNDNDQALKLAYLLSENKSPDLADWAKQMPVFILHDQGESDLAYKIMLNLLITNVDKLHPNEVFFMKDYICNTLVPAQTQNPRPNFCDEL